MDIACKRTSLARAKRRKGKGKQQHNPRGGGGVLQTLSDGDDRMGQKSKPKNFPRASNKTQKKKIPRASNKTQKIP